MKRIIVFSVLVLSVSVGVFSNSSQEESKNSDEVITVDFEYLKNDSINPVCKSVIPPRSVRPKLD